MSDAIVEVKHLKKYFQVKNGLLHAVDNVNFVIPKGTTMGLVGESGCGKSTIGRLILRLTEATEGEILFEGQDIRKLNKKDMRQMPTEDPDGISGPVCISGWKKKCI